MSSSRACTSVGMHACSSIHDVEFKEHGDSAGARGRTSKISSHALLSSACSAVCRWRGGMRLERYPHRDRQSRSSVWRVWPIKLPEWSRSPETLRRSTASCMSAVRQPGHIPARSSRRGSQVTAWPYLPISRSAVVLSGCRAGWPSDHQYARQHPHQERPQQAFNGRDGPEWREWRAADDIGGAGR